MTRLDELIKEYGFHSYNILCESPIIFLSGAMTGLSDEEQKGWRVNLTQYFNNQYMLIDPTVFDAESENEEAQRIGHDYDLCGITNCNYFVINLNNVTQSVGTCQEIMYAWLLYKPILGFWENEELVQPLHPWIRNKLSKHFSSIEDLKTYLQLEYYRPKEKNNE